MHQRYLTTLSTCTYSQYTEYYLLSYSSKGNSPYSFFVHTKLLVGCWIVSVSMSLYAYVPNWMQEILIISRQKICAKAIHIKPYSLKFVIDCFKIQEIGEKAVCIHWNMPLSGIGCKRCVKQLLKGCHLHWIMFLISIGPRRCVPKQYTFHRW